MGLFDSAGDLSVKSAPDFSIGDYGNSSFWQSGDSIVPSLSTLTPTANSFSLSMFGGGSIIPDGVTLIDQRSNTSFFGGVFDQSKVTASIFDVMKSGVEAAGKVGVQLAGDSINRNANQQGFLGSLARNFRSTSTICVLFKNQPPFCIIAVLKNLEIHCLINFMFIK